MTILIYWRSSTGREIDSVRQHILRSPQALSREGIPTDGEATDNDTEDGDEKGQTPGLELGAIRHFLPLANGNVAMGGREDDNEGDADLRIPLGVVLVASLDHRLNRIVVGVEIVGSGFAEYGRRLLLQVAQRRLDHFRVSLPGELGAIGTAGGTGKRYAGFAVRSVGEAAAFLILRKLKVLHHLADGFVGHQDAGLAGGGERI